MHPALPWDINGHSTKGNNVIGTDSSDINSQYIPRNWRTNLYSNTGTLAPMRPSLEVERLYTSLAPTNWWQLIYWCEGTVKIRLTPTSPKLNIMSSLLIIIYFYGPNNLQNRGLAQGTCPSSPFIISSITSSEIILFKSGIDITGHWYSSQVQT